MLSLHWFSLDGRKALFWSANNFHMWLSKHEAVELEYFQHFLQIHCEYSISVVCKVKPKEAKISGYFHYLASKKHLASPHDE